MASLTQQHGAASKPRLPEGHFPACRKSKTLKKGNEMDLDQHSKKCWGEDPAQQRSALCQQEQHSFPQGFQAQGAAVAGVFCKWER